MSLLIIDIREEQEVLDYQLITTKNDIVIINIPTRNIFSNVDFINQLSEQFNTIFIVCKSDKRAARVKNKYFVENPRILTLDGGINSIIDENIPGIHVIDNHSLLNLAPQQYMQTVIVIFLCILVVLNYIEIDRIYINGALLAFAVFIAYQIITKNCKMSSIISLSDSVRGIAY